MEHTEPILMMAAADPDGFLISPYLRSAIFLMTVATLCGLVGFGLQRPNSSDTVARGGMPNSILSRKHAIVCAFALFAIGCLGVWAFEWTAFKGLEVRGSQMTLHYYMPHRTVKLEQANVKRTVLVHEGKGSYSIVVRTQDDERYRSTPVTGRSFREKFHNSGLPQWPKGR